jgi:MoaA/NifB/PqqE/SkfB family radical SAM enzyme
MPRCDFGCGGCYLGRGANAVAPRPVEEIQAQMRAIRSWLGPGGNLQLTDGEVTLRAESELIELIAYARSIGLVPMLMTHGETFRREPEMLERLMTAAGLTEVCFHVDTTMRGRRDGFAAARTEADLDPLRAEFADLIRRARRRTGRRLECASTVTVTHENLDGVAGIVRWFLRNADAFKMVSFQPLGGGGAHPGEPAGRERRSVVAAHRRRRRQRGARRSYGYLGHPQCSRFVQGVAVRRRGATTLVPLYRGDDPADARSIDDLFHRIGGSSFRLDTGAQALRRAAALLGRHGAVLVRHGVPYLWRLARRVRTVRARYFCIVSHRFMSAAETDTAIGRERLAACAFRVPIGDRLEPMCAVNARGLRDAFYRGTATANGRRMMPTPYGLFAAAGCVVAVLWLQRHREGIGVTENEFWAAMWALLLGGIVGGQGAVRGARLGALRTRRDQSCGRSSASASSSSAASWARCSRQRSSPASVASTSCAAPTTSRSRSRSATPSAASAATTPAAATAATAIRCSSTNRPGCCSSRSPAAMH